jgi:transposase
MKENKFNIQEFKKIYKVFKITLNERQIRLFLANEANKYSQAKIAQASGVAKDTIRKGQNELKNKSYKLDINRIRKSGGGRKTKIKDPKTIKIIKEIIENYIKGDPEKIVLNVALSCMNISKEFKKNKIELSPRSVSTLLRQEGYSLQSNKKSLKEKPVHIDRDKQFKLIGKLTKQFLKERHLVISVDTKKKENLGNYKNNGKIWREKGKPIEVLDHDFITKETIKISPYGIYDVGNNKGFISVGITADTAEFATNSIRQWLKIGKKTNKKLKKILILADSGGSNGNKVRLWKLELQKIANEEKIEISVCHFPAGTSKWNKIEHQLFSFISKRWRGLPLIDLHTVIKVIKLIKSTKTNEGLSVKAIIDKKIYKKGVKVSKSDYKKINIIRNKFHGEWNYSILPQR